MRGFDIIMIILASGIGSLCRNSLQPGNDTVREIVFGTGLGMCLATGISLIIYDMYLKDHDKHITAYGLAVLLGALGNKTTSQIGKGLVNKYLKSKRLKDEKQK